jgi:lipopolysaccharide/colanic/teichoic acid biosynthesis glycosyltransferase
VFYNKYGKRLFDVLAVSLTIPLWLPLIFIVSIAIYTVDGLPILYFGERVGKDMETFNIVKFRTMFVDTGREETGDTVFDGDSRVTKLGKILRKYKLDEIPQLFLVLIGRMSLVGPRPELSIYVNKDYYIKNGISSLRPGITDYSSIKYRNLSAIESDGCKNKFIENKIIPRKNKLRRLYSKKVSFCTDLFIILRTIRNIF